MEAINIERNRALFLSALRSGEYPKGPIETDAKGRPVDPNAEGFCAVGLAHYLFFDPSRPKSPIPIREALGLLPRQFARIQQEWNDSDLTFPEIADLIEREMF
ncbi:MAG TPA: hypothetical protein VFR55_04230 [Dehalococcoidia bacterium]|nr:hypothetical protein [Dehalococcoidia bacterium]